MKTVNGVHVVKIVVQTASEKVGNEKSFSRRINRIFYCLIEYNGLLFQNLISVGNINATHVRVRMLFSDCQ